MRWWTAARNGLYAEDVAEGDAAPTARRIEQSVSPGAHRVTEPTRCGWQPKRRGERSGLGEAQARGGTVLLAASEGAGSYRDVFVVLLHVVEHLVHLAEGDGRVGVGGAVVDGDASRRGVVDGRAGEEDVGHEAGRLVGLLRRQQVVAAAVEHLRRVLEVEEAAPKL